MEIDDEDNLIRSRTDTKNSCTLDGKRDFIHRKSFMSLASPNLELLDEQEQPINIEEQPSIAGDQQSNHSPREEKVKEEEESKPELSKDYMWQTKKLSADETSTKTFILARKRSLDITSQIRTRASSRGDASDRLDLAVDESSPETPIENYHSELNNYIVQSQWLSPGLQQNPRPIRRIEKKGRLIGAARLNVRFDIKQAAQPQQKKKYHRRSKVDDGKFCVICGKDLRNKGIEAKTTHLYNCKTIEQKRRKREVEEANKRYQQPL